VAWGWQQAERATHACHCAQDSRQGYVNPFTEGTCEACGDLHIRPWLTSSPMLDERGTVKVYLNCSS